MILRFSPMQKRKRGWRSKTAKAILQMSGLDPACPVRDALYMYQECDGNRLVKLGRAADLYRRLHREIVRSAVPKPITVLAAVDGAASLEKAALQHLAHHCHNGEWLHPDPEVFAFARAIHKNREALIGILAAYIPKEPTQLQLFPS